MATIMALFWCAVLEMLICVCEALDARAAAEARVAAAAPRDAEPGAVPALRAGRRAPSSEARACRLALVPEVHAMLPKLDDVPCGATERPAPATPWLAWSRDPGPIRAIVLAPPWRPRRETRIYAPAVKHAHIVTI